MAIWAAVLACGPFTQANAPVYAETLNANCGGDVDEIRRHATALVNLGPRVDSSASAKAAVDLIDSQLRQLGLTPIREPIGAVNLKRIKIRNRLIRRAHTATSSSENIWVHWGGSGPSRVFLAHYDTVSNSPGAVDNAAAVGILLELARCWAANPPPGPVIIAFPGGEERGLLGAHKLAEHLTDRVELAVSLDLVGRQSHLAINGLGTQWELNRLSWLADRVNVANISNPDNISNISADAPLIHRVISRWLPQLERSDHGAFADRGIPSLHLYGRDPGRIYLPYHTAADSIDQLTDAALINALEFTREIATADKPLPAVGNDIGMWLPQIPLIAGSFVVSHFWIFLIEILLAILGIVLILLCWLRRRRSTQMRAIGLWGVLLILLIGFLATAIAGQLERMIHDDPLSFAHKPSQFIGALLGLAGSVSACVAVIVGGWVSFIRGTRYHLTAALLTLFPGLLMLGFDVIELAWLPLTAAVLFALAGRLLERPIACTITTALGVVLSLAPTLAPAAIREAIFHGFYPPGLPLAGYLAVVTLPSCLAIIGSVRARFVSPGNRVALVLAFVFFAFAAVCVAALLVPEPTCSAEQNRTYGLACELGSALAPTTPTP